MMGSCRELFGHFVLMSEVLSAAVSCKLPLNFAHSSSLYLFLFLLLWFSLLLFVHFDSSLCQFFFLWKFMCNHNPSFWSAISRSDPFDVNCYIFNPDLDNGAATVIFAPGLFTALRQSMSLTLCIPPYFNHTEQCRATLQQKLCLYHIFKF